MGFKLLNYKSIYKIFWNQYLIEDCALHRVKHIKYLKKRDYYIHVSIIFLKFLGKDLISFTSLSSFLIGYLRYKKIILHKKNIFLFTRSFEVNNISKKFHNLRVNLNPFIKLNETSRHIYSLLEFKEIFKIIIITLINSPYLYFELFIYCRIERINFFKFILLTKLTLTSILELNLLFVCLTKIDKKHTVSNSEHFTPYMQLLSFYKVSKKNNVWSLNLYQHGVYEIDKFNRLYNKVYADKIFFKFKQSVKWIKENFVLNQDCSFSSFRSTQSFKTYLKTNPKNKLIAYASSGFYRQDNVILERLYFFQRENKNIEIIFYPHPHLNKIHAKNLKKKYSSLKLIFFERFSNIDLCITGYSSLGLDYSNLDVKVLFIPFEDSICAFKDNSLEILKDPNLLNKKLNEILNV